jgi:L-threonylcarbamoyladenylate synthase
MIMISNDIYQAAYLLNTDEVVAVPTETVYGLAGNIYSELAIKKIFEIKKRPFTNPLIVHVGSMEMVHTIADEIPQLAQQLMDAFWPGPLTLVLHKHTSVPSLITGSKDTVAIRMPNHPVMLQLLTLLDYPLAAPSANPFGMISPTSAQHVDHYFDTVIPMTLEGGDCKNGIESTIIGFEEGVPVLYRLGAISIEDIEREIGVLQIHNFEEKAPHAPGMMLKHYAPKTKTLVVPNILDAVALYTGKRIGLLVFVSKMSSEGVVHQEQLSETGDLAEAASNLYAAMHRLDALHLDVIIAEQFPNSELGRAINDRLHRASTL